MNKQNYKICTVITGDTIEQFLKNLEKVQEISDMVEVRVDYINDVNLDMIKNIKTKLKTPAILTCRGVAEGGNFKDTTKKQETILNKAQELGYEYIDIDINLMNKIVLNNTITKKIISYHNFEEMLSLLELEHIKKQMQSMQADICKFALKINNKNDTKVIYRLLLNKFENEKIIAIGMGKLGQETRIIGPLLGSYLTFASTKYGQSAEGQIDIDKLQKIYENINNT